MSNVQLDTPILTGGILNTNFFNGRVLSAEDLTDFQTANAQQHRQLGTAIGEGIACGFEVSLGSTDPAQPVLHVTKGLALNRKGDPVALSTDVDLALVTPLDTQNAPSGLFAACAPPQGVIPTNLDCYILTATPVAGKQGSAPMTGLASAGFASSCASRYVVEGVQFGMLPLGVTASADPATLRGTAVKLHNQLKPLFVQLVGLPSPASDTLKAQIAPLLSQFRNVVAHLCFGTEPLQSSAAADAFGRANGRSLVDTYGVLDDLRAQNYLTPCAVPLALVYWTAAGIQFVDTWPVRRPVFPAAASHQWPLFSGRRRAAEGLSMFLQFQGQIAGLPATLGSASRGSVTATNYFRYLPAAGFLPIGNVNPASGFDYLQFFSNHTFRSPVFIEGAILDQLISTSFLYPPIDLTAKELVFLYQVRENQETIDNAVGSSPVPYLVFTNGQIGFQGKSRFDLNYWNYANYV